MCTWLLVAISTAEWTLVYNFMVGSVVLLWFYDRNMPLWSLIVQKFVTLWWFMLDETTGIRHHFVIPIIWDIWLLNFLYPCWMWTPDFNLSCRSPPAWKGSLPYLHYSQELRFEFKFKYQMTDLQNRNRWFISECSQFSVVWEWLIPYYTHWWLSIARTPKSPLEDLGPFFHVFFPTLVLATHSVSVCSPCVL